ncbi:NUDIX hydrolase [Amphibacillus jilinensis]|uniref:NUDIX hydrolase n=1 Tax=Amphibacillus jilinensis TaxID=1216008 RepID=UPI0002FF5C8F|nr:NUDIX domain-containing protein [Amphibacillus jilinensis]
MEIWDIYDKDRRLTGETIERGASLKQQDYHLVVHVCIFNTNGEMLIQQRQSFKKGWSNLWDITVGGSAVSGDTSQLAAEREVFEEIGYAINLSNCRPSLTIHADDAFDDIYLLEEDLDIKQLKLQYEEVQNVKWATEQEIISLVNENKFIPYYKGFISLLFEMRKYRGVHKR